MATRRICYVCARVRRRGIWAAPREIDHWQNLLAGLIALIAAIITVFVTLKVERRKVDREIDALRKSLAIELRQLIPRALGAHSHSDAPPVRATGRNFPPSKRYIVPNLASQIPVALSSMAWKTGSRSPGDELITLRNFGGRGELLQHPLAGDQRDLSFLTGG